MLAPLTAIIFLGEGVKDGPRLRCLLKHVYVKLVSTNETSSMADGVLGLVMRVGYKGTTRAITKIRKISCYSPMYSLAKF